jgi:hypothetical protein
MRISKLLSAICAAAILAGSATVRAQDTTEQATARAALMQKISELDAQQAATNAAATTTPTTAATPSAAVNPPPAVMATPAPAPAPVETPLSGASAQAIAHAALMQKMAELDAQQVATNTAAPSSPVILAPVETQPATSVPASVESSSMQKATAEAEAAAKAKAKADQAAAAAKAKADAQQAAAELKAKKEADRKAAKQKAADEAAAKARAKANQAAIETQPEAPAAAAPETATPTVVPGKASGTPSVVIFPPPAKPAAPTAVASKKSKAKPAKPAAPAVAPVVKPVPQPDLNYAGKSLGFKPVEAPPPPVSEQKVAKLQALLAKYMANQIAPDEYQKERAAILAEP